MHDLSEESSIHNRKISEQAYANRTALRACMMAADFAPYNGEWWHFSHGDREHALWSEEKEAFYTPHSFNPAEQSFAAWTEAKFNYIDFIKDMGEQK
jgi:D-alanyl-D-alanine dipeptidase